MAHLRRTYRRLVEAEGLSSFGLTMGQTNLMILAPEDLTEEARAVLRDARRELHDYRKRDPEFFEALKPHQVPDDAPPLVKEMAGVAVSAEVGPMAAVAGAIAERVGRGLLEFSDEVVVENGGDLFISSRTVRTVGVFAGRSLLSGKLAIKIAASQTPLGVGCSSSSVGPSISFGKTDASVVLATSSALADAVATGLGNRVGSIGDLERAVGWAVSLEGVTGALVIMGENLAAQGQIELAEPGCDR